MKKFIYFSLLIGIISMLCLVPVFADTFNIEADEKEHTVEWKNTPQSAPFELQKVDKKTGAATTWTDRYGLANAIFKVDYTDGGSVKRTWYLKTDENGHATLDDLVNAAVVFKHPDGSFVNYKSDERFKNSKGEYVIPLGTVTVTEVEAPKGYVRNDGELVLKIDWDGKQATNETTSNVTVSKNTTGTYDTKWTLSSKNPLKVTVEDMPQSAPIKIQKFDNKTESANTWHDSYDLSGAVFKVDYTDGKDVNRTWYLETKADGTTTLDSLVSSSKQFTHPDGNTVTYKSDERFTNSKGEYVVPLGDVTITEVEAPYGYVRNEGEIKMRIDWDADGSQSSNETTRNITEMSNTFGKYDAKWELTSSDPWVVTVEDQPQSAPIKLQKIDRETGQPVPMGAASLANAVFEINYKSFKGGTNNTWYIKTDDKGVATLDSLVDSSEVFLQSDGVTKHSYTSDERYTNFAGEFVIPLGTVTIKEVEAPEGYLKNDGNIIIRVDWDGSQASDETTSTITVDKHNPDKKDAYTANWYLTSPNPWLVTVEDQVIRSDYEFVKRDTEELKKYTNLPFVIRSATTGEYHVVATNDNEKVRTAYKDHRRDVPHTRNTNGNDDKVLDTNGNPIINELGLVDKSEVSYNRGTWFYKDKEGNEAKEVNDGLGALPYDTYYATELRVEDVKDKQLIINKEFKVVTLDDNSYADDDYVIFGGSWDNDPKEPEYEIYKVRNEDAPANKYGEGFGFKEGDKITYNVYIANNSVEGDIRMDVSDTFKEHPEYFSLPVVKEVKDAEQNSISDDKNTVNITIKPQTTATVVYEVEVLKGANEYLAAEAKDSDSLNDKNEPCNEQYQANTPDDNDGYRNEAETNNVFHYGKKGETKQLGPKKDPAQTPIQETPSYEMYKVRNEDAILKAGTKQFGFEMGSKVTYNVVVKNTSPSLSLTMNVTDEMTEHPEYFSLPVVKEVKDAVENSRSEDGNKVNITVDAGHTAIVVYEVEINSTAEEYLANAAKDSDSLDAEGNDTNKENQANETDDNDGYKNVAKVTNPTPHKPDPPKPTEPPYPNGKEVLISKANVDSEELPGAHMVLTDKEGKVVDVWVSTTEPHMVKLDAGEYFLQETVAPEGYVVITTFGFTVDENGNVTTTSAEAKCEEAHVTVLDHAGDTPTLEPKEDEAQTPVKEPTYEMYKVRNEDAFAKGKKFGFHPGDVITYNVVVKNTSDVASLTLDVTDEMTEHPEYFSLPVVKEVKDAVENSRSEDNNKVNITVDAGHTGIVVYEVTVLNNAKEYLADEAKDSDSLDAEGNDTNRENQANKPNDNDGYKNEATADNVVPNIPGKPDQPGKPLTPKKDEAQTPVQETVIKVTIAKADKEKVKYYLKGAEITIFDEDGNIVKDTNGKKCVGKTDENGLVTFNVNFTSETSYYAQETKAPKGYEINKDKFELEQMDNDTFKTKIDIKILDQAIVIPPAKTGDDTNMTLYVILLVLALGAMSTTIAIVRKRKITNNN